jgi:1-acyl-sn-glycerol-3-phosphate acyltransferase
MSGEGASVDMPEVRPVFHTVFVSYIHWMLRRHFHAVRLSRTGAAPGVDARVPLIVYLNHASWWDPLLALWLGKHCFHGRKLYGPFEAAQIERYSFFRKLGGFGVEQGAVGARAFLRTSEALLLRPGSMLWLTPQGRFADVRERPARFAPGLGHLACRVKGAVCVPVALEYSFGQERLPEVFVRFGACMEASEIGSDAFEAGAGLERALESCQDALRDEVCSRNPAAFEVLLDGAGGASLPYDLWRCFLGRLVGRRAELNHGAA